MAASRPCEPGRLGHGGHRLRQPTLVGRPPPQTPDPMDLLGDVGQQEVRRKRADQIGCGVDRQPGQQGPNIASSPVPINLETGLLALLGQRSHPFDEVEQLRAFLAHQRFAEQSHDAAHVGSEGGVRVRGNRQQVSGGVVGRSTQQSRRFRVDRPHSYCLPHGTVASS